MLRATKNKILGLLVIIFAVVLVLLCGGCALKMNDIERTLPNGTKEKDKSFELGTPAWSTGKEMNLIKVM